MKGPSVYVHIPFCEARCPYCDFNSFAVEGRDVDGYLKALRAEFDARGVPADPSTVYVGGGTPTVVEPETLERYLSDLVARVEPDAEREFTVEANPGSLTAEKVAVLKAAGVNRISIGAQSVHDRHLATLGRVHRAHDAEEAFRLAREGGIRNVSVDLVYSVPGMKLSEWLETLDVVTGWGPDHLSCYSLTIEPGTEFFARRLDGRLKEAPEELQLAMFRLTERRLRGRGYGRYEISNFARPGRRCRHNLTYWRNERYIGFGAGAFSFVAGERLGNERGLERYAGLVRERGEAFVRREHLNGMAGAREMVVLGLRTTEGVDLGEVGRRYGVDAAEEFRPLLETLREGRFLAAGPRVRLARRGWRVADEIAAAFL